MGIKRPFVALVFLGQMFGCKDAAAPVNDGSRGNSSGGADSAGTKATVAAQSRIAPPPTVQPEVPPEPGAPRASATPGTWIVAGDAGVIEIDLQGKAVRTISKTRARSPRWLPGHTHVLFLGELEGAFVDLRRLEIATGKEARVVLLPDGPPCLPDAYAGVDREVPTLSLTTEAEFWIEPKSKFACIELADHEADLRTTSRAMSVRLSDGRIDDRVTFGATEVCGLADQERPAVCDEHEPKRSEAIASPIPNRPPEAVSPSSSKQWLLVEVASALGDVVHRNFVLFDSKTKTTYPLPRGQNRAWPKPSTLDFADLDPETMIPSLDDVGGSEAIVWIGDHHLVIGHTLFIAGESIVELPGDPAL